MIAAALLLGFAASAAPATCAQEPSRFLLLRNSSVPEGAEVVRAWRDWRGMPDAPELVLDLPSGERVPRAVYEREVAAPIREFLRSPAGAEVQWLIPVFGMPLGIDEQPGLDGARQTDQQRNEAAVDSELALVAATSVRTDGWVESPLFDRDRPLEAADELLGVIRLDGPTAAIAAALPAKAVLAETFGSGGRSFLDTRGLADEKDGYGFRDVHMRTVRAAWDRLGLAYDHDDVMDVVDVSARPDFLHYEAWYAGDPSAWRGRLRFRTGAIAVHLHSFAAHTLRDPRANWCAPLLAAGATATYGTVYEPYTIGFPYEGIFWDRLARGWSFGEAAVASSQLVSWQAVFIGDPLHRPYAEGFAEAQSERRLAMATALGSWPQAPVSAPFAAFPQIWSGLDARLRQIVHCAKSADTDGAVSALEALLFECRGWGFEDAFARALAPAVGPDLKRELGSLEQQLVRDPAQPAACERLARLAELAPLFGWGERHADLVQKVRKRQEDLVARVLDDAEPSVRSGRLLARWRALSRAGRCSLATRAPEAAAARQALEADADRGPALLEEAEASLQKALRDVDPLLRKERWAEARARLEQLDLEHPECPAKATLRELLGRATAGGG